jgi:hypothetical protein
MKVGIMILALITSKKKAMKRLGFITGLQPLLEHVANDKKW